MKVVFSFFAVLALAAGLSFAADEAKAGGDFADEGYGGCYGAACGAYLVPRQTRSPCAG